MTEKTQEQIAAEQADLEAKAAAKAEADAKKAADKEAKELAKAEAKAKREADAVARKAEKEAEKERVKAEREAVKEAKKAEKEAEKARLQAEKEASRMPEQNGIRRPKADTLCGKAWAIFDDVSQNSGEPASIGASMEVSRAQGLNDGNVRAEYARWRKFHGITGRIAAPKAETESAE